MTIERRPKSDAAEGEPDSAVVTGLALDVVFPVLHGPYGEDGTVQGLLELASVPYVGSGVLASALGMDKAAMKAAFAAHGLPQTAYAVVSHFDWTRRPGEVEPRLRALGLPLFVKPANLGSSVGISKVKAWEELAAALDTAFAFDRKAVVEAAVPEAREIECAILGNDEPDASLPGEVLPSREFYDYEAKYIDSASQTVVPADLDADDGRARAGAVDRRLPRHRRRRHGPRRLPAVAPLRDAACSTRSTPSPASRPSACTRRCGRPAACPTPRWSIG